uniref:Uncharacterized protein n=1 Tax=Setaria italica TaxID=4555 RepID=K3XUN6_SETIT
MMFSGPWINRLSHGCFAIYIIFLFFFMQCEVLISVKFAEAIFD